MADVPQAKALAVQMVVAYITKSAPSFSDDKNGERAGRYIAGIYSLVYAQVLKEGQSAPVDK